MADLGALGTHLAGLGRILVGYSGGVDSALLAVAARRVVGAERLLAVIGRSPSYPEIQWRTARALADQFDVPLLELRTRELDDPRYLANPTNRCFFCKSELWSRLERVRSERGFDVVLDGTNADDLTEHRPGHRAGQTWAVQAPLADLGWTKAAVRDAARTLGLPTWDAPAAPCLSSRVRYGLAITPNRLHQVEAGESLLRDLGVAGDLRVRHHDDLARIEVRPDQFALLEDRWPEVVAGLRALGFARVERDPGGYRRGHLIALATGSA